ncbi:uncharacterized protein LOC111709836 [Eurytemora carolleeae]|uniref:uncharacterized protein LOC111709836 n=1 Tax=Eurytemora carolleeae TaxID=1294199 RepID=UPI000C75EAFF|nr:uncharacterized protein LOC111709836 [Eurytemora carolleeae]|eukprot:XP_023339522.1 uncharacterized protein LOC111709836 [Eurytemora affinis]
MVTKPDLAPRKEKAMRRVHFVKDEDLPIVFPHSCIRTPRITSRAVDFILCIKHNELISNEILRKGMFHGAAVTVMMDLLANYPNGTLLDLGSNLGSFSVAAAAFNYSVVSVDPFLHNHAYSRLSTSLLGSQKYVTYIQNTVSNGTEPLYPWFREPTNQGRIFFVNKESADKLPVEEIGSPVHPVNLEDILETITTEILIIKIDIEGHECKALLPFLERPEKTKYVPYIMMEWVIIRRNREGLCPNLKQLVKAFLQAGYFPVGMNLRRVSLKTAKYWDDVIWVHQQAIF